MANYLKATDFAAKDALLSGDPNKIVKGTEIDDEFDSIQTAVNSKANVNSPVLTGVPTAPTALTATSNTQLATTAFVHEAITLDTTGPLALKAPLASPALTGTPTAPTAGLGTNNNQLATTAFVQAAMSAAYPVGSIYTNAAVATNPSTLLGFGTWAAFGSGRVLVGVEAGNAPFDTLGETGGSKDATVVSHTHTGTTGGASSDHTHSGTTDSQGSHEHDIRSVATGGLLQHTLASGAAPHRISDGSISGVPASKFIAASAGAHAHNITTGGVSSGHDHSFTTGSTGSSGTNANLQPYITVYMWKRTA